jgi:hypothetical protein
MGTGGSTTTVGGGGNGGSAGSGGTAGTGGTGGSGGIEGSYDLTFKGVVATTRPGSQMTSPPSEGASVRVDLRLSTTAASYDAVVTPRWGTPTAYTVTASDAELKLSGAATISGGTFDYRTDKWTDLRLARDAMGGLSGSVRGSGEETIIMGDVIDTAQLTTMGSITRDATPPEIRSEVSSPLLPAGQVLPWDTLRVRAAEGVDASRWAAGLSVARANADAGAPMPVTKWVTAPTDATSWSGAVTADGKLQTWDDAGGIAMTVGAPGAAVVDRASQSMAKDFSSAFSFLNILLAAPDSYALGMPPTPLPAQWGDVAAHGVSGADALCESGVCLLIGPFDNNYCSVGRRGVAGRLAAPRTAGGSMATKVVLRVRYRVLTAGTSVVPNGPAPFSVDVVALGVDPHTTEIAPPTLHDLGAGAGEFHLASDFLDAVAPGPDTAAPEYGFAIYAGTRSTINCGPGGGGLLPPPVKTEVVIDKITIEPG